jgi:hypothetical protein
MKTILIAAAFVAVIGGAIGVAGTRHAKPLHDELRWTEASANWAQR